MAAHTHVAVGYNAQIAVDAKHKLIVEQQVTNQVVDMGLLAQTAEPARTVLGVERIDVVADRGYFKIENIEACEKTGIDAYLPRPQRGQSVSASRFRKDEFRYDPASDSFTCPAGQQLAPYTSSLLRGLKRINYATWGLSLPPRPRPITMQPLRTSIWLHDSNKTASGKTGTLQNQNRSYDWASEISSESILK